VRTLFVTGSGTGVGKTFVSSRLLAALPPSLRLRCLKPVVSGYAAATAADSDPGRLLAAQAIPIAADAIAAISPWRFRAALSADMAAAREQRSIPFAELVAFCRAGPEIGLTLIEGVGGVMAPIDARHTVLDWIAALRSRVVLVVGSYLGSLSHALTAVAAIQSRGLQPLAVVVSQSADEPVPMAETAATLRRFVAPVPVLTLPRQHDADAAELAGLVLSAFGLD
jgi:dethiobiotin synthetase